MTTTMTPSSPAILNSEREKRQQAREKEKKKNDEVSEGREEVIDRRDRDDFTNLSLDFKGNYKKMTLVSFLCQKICVHLSFLFL